MILTNGFTISLNDFLEFYSASRVLQELYGSDGQNTYMLYTLQEYPGTRVANAYLNKNTAWLSQDEMKLYNVAVGIVNKAKKEKNFLAQEMEIYVQIMERVEYLSGDMSHQPRFVTAIGALVDGKANCQGYADAFYMLGRMMGWNVGKLGGKTSGSHVWNWIEINGKTYFVDATYGDSLMQKSTDGKRAHSYIYFNAPVEIMEVTHTWDWSLAPQNLQPSVDNLYSYSNFRGNLARTTSVEAGLQLLAKELNDGKHSWFSVMTPYDEKFDHNHVQQVINYLDKILNKKYYVYVCTYGRYIFFNVYLS